MCIRDIEICLLPSTLNWVKVAFISNRIETNELTDRWLQTNKLDVHETQRIAFFSSRLVINFIFCCLWCFNLRIIRIPRPDMSNGHASWGIAPPLRHACTSLEPQISAELGLAGLVELGLATWRWNDGWRWSIRLQSVNTWVCLHVRITLEIRKLSTHARARARKHRQNTKKSIS